MVAVTELALPAPAKLNLFLHITGRRADGYHLLQTLFQLLDYGDELQFRLQPGEITLEQNLNDVSADDNLVVRAARLLQSSTGCTRGVAIRLSKRLPLGGGLGGGSSDAATTLLALNSLWQLGLSVDQLADLGLQLGADVPVFVRGRSALGEGVGEQLRPVEIPPCWYLVICPQIVVNTGEIFAHPELTRDSAPIKIPPLLEEDQRNDCQAVVERLYPEIAAARDWLGQREDSARLTGTGSCLFASFENEADARKVLAEVPAKWSAFLARGLNHSPVHQRLAELTAE